MSPLARDVAFASLAVPFVVAAVAALLARLAPERHRTAAIAAAPALGFLVAYVQILGLPALPPRSAAEKLPLLTVAAWTMAALLRARAPRVEIVWIAALFALAVLWIAWPRLDTGAFAVEAAVPWAAGTAGLVALGGTRGGSLRHVAPLAAVAIGLTGPALAGRVIYVVQLDLAVAATLAAVALAGLIGRARLTPAALAPAATALLGLGTVLALYSRAAPWLLVLAWLPLLAGRIAPRLARSRRREPWLFVLLCAGPAALAVVLGRWAAGPPGS